MAGVLLSKDSVWELVKRNIEHYKILEQERASCSSELTDRTGTLGVDYQKGGSICKETRGNTFKSLS